MNISFSKVQKQRLRELDAPVDFKKNHFLVFKIEIRLFVI